MFYSLTVGIFFSRQKSFTDTDELMANAIYILMSWLNAYTKTRRYIELGEKALRWEFDRKRLFGETDWLATVCSDLCKMIQVRLL